AVERGGLTGVRVKRGGSVDIHRVVDRLREGATAFIASSDAFDGPRDEVATRLAAVASAVLAEVGPALLVLTGGDTALAVSRALGARRLELDGAPASGLALGRLVRDGRPPLTVLTKAGGFGAPDPLASLVKGAVGCPVVLPCSASRWAIPPASVPRSAPRPSPCPTSPPPAGRWSLAIGR